MIRLIRRLLAIFAYFCIGTVIAHIIIVGYLIFHWQIDRERLLNAIAAAQGMDLAPSPPPVAAPLEPKEHKEEPAEQISFEQILEARAIKNRNFELREQALKNGADQLRFEQNRLAEQQQALQNSKLGFEGTLAAIEKQATEGGWDDARRILLNARPRQAKELIVQMLEKNELYAVVTLMAPMPDNRRARIIAEFRTPEEVKKIGEVIREIRRGDPTTAVTANVRQQLDQSQTPPKPQGSP